MNEEKPKIIKLQNNRWLFGVIGLVLLAAGQITMANPQAFPSSTSQLGNFLNIKLHFGIANIDSVLFGLFLLLTGGYFLFRGLQGSPVLPSTKIAFIDKPAAIKKVFRTWPLVLVGTLLFVFLLVKLNRLEYSAAFPWIWIVAIVIFFLVMAIWDIRRGVNLSPGLPRRDLVLLIGLLITGLLITTYRLQGWPDQLMPDENIFGATAHDIVTRAFAPPLFAQGVDSFPIMATYWQALIMKIFGLNMWGWRFGSVLPGVAAVIPFYLLTRDIFDRRIAIISSIVLLTNPYFLVYSRLGYTNIQPLFITTLVLYLLFIALKRSSYLFTFLGGCIAGLGFYTYFSGRGAVVVALLFIFLLWITKQVKFRAMVYTYLIMGLGVLLVIAPYIVYGIHQDLTGMAYRFYLSFFNSVVYGGSMFSQSDLLKFAPFYKIGELEYFYNPLIFLILILRGFVITLLTFQKTGFLWGQHYLVSPLAGTTGTVFYLIGLAIMIKKARTARLLLITLWFFVFIAFFSALNTFPPREDHMVPINPAIALLTGIGLSAVSLAIQNVYSRLKTFGNVILGILLVIVAAGGLIDYFVLSPPVYTQAPDQIMSWAGLDSSNGESFIYVYQDPSQKDFKPYVLNVFRTDIPYQTASIEDLVSGKVNLTPGIKTIIFYLPELGEKISEFLRSQWGEVFSQRTFLGTDGKPVLLAGMNTAFNFERDRPILNTFLDAFRQIPFDILLIILALLFASAVFLPTTIFNPVKAAVRSLGNWISRSDQTEEKLDLPERIDYFEEPLKGMQSPGLVSQSVLAENSGWNQLLAAARPPKKGWLTMEFMTMDGPHDTEVAQGKVVYIHFHLPSLRPVQNRLSREFEINIPAIHIHFASLILLILSVIFVSFAFICLNRHATEVGICLITLSVVSLFLWLRRIMKK